MSVTIKDIAERTGLSMSTISLVLNNKESRISEETRKLVLATAKEMKYQPNRIAVSLVKRKSRLIGLMVPDISNAFFSLVAKGAEDEARERQYNIMLCNTSESPERDYECIRTFCEHRADGLILILSSHTDQGATEECLSEAEDRGVPYIAVDRPLVGYSKNMVLTNQRRGGYLAARHLLELGHRHIGCVTGDMEEGNAKERYAGYRDALKEFGVPAEKEMVWYGEYTMDSGIAAAKALIGNGATAIFAMNDIIACGVFRGARQLGVKIPDDLSLIGYDGTILTELLEVPLSTIIQPAYQMGRAACRDLLDLVEGSSDSASVRIFEPKLLIRNSTGAPGICEQQLKKGG